MNQGSDEPRRGYHVIEQVGPGSTEPVVLDRPVEEDEVIQAVTSPLHYRITELESLLTQLVREDPAARETCPYCFVVMAHEPDCPWVRARSAIRG